MTHGAWRGVYGVTEMVGVEDVSGVDCDVTQVVNKLSICFSFLEDIMKLNIRLRALLS